MIELETVSRDVLVAHSYIGIVLPEDDSVLPEL